MEEAETAVPLYDNLGDHHIAVTTSAVAQRYFDQGMRLYYAFNHAEAIRAFDEAARLDPDCAMCYWGHALALGPNINMPMDSASGAAAHVAAQEALKRQDRASPVERALIEALATRYVETPGPDRSRLDSLYARAMGGVAERFPAHPEVLSLYAEAKHLSRALQMRVRFSRWDEILAAPAPPAEAPYARAIWHYARGRALAALGDAQAAAAQLEGLRREASDATLRDAPVEFNPATALLDVAGGVLDGYIAAAEGDYPAAIDRLKAAAAAEDELVYGEPPEWSVPVRQDLGEILLTAGRAAEAEAAFRKDLHRFPASGWSLHGLSRSLEAQGRESEAAVVREQLAESWATADVPLAGL